MADEDLFRDFEKFKKGKSKGDTKMSDKEIHIHIKFNKLMFERAIYWIIILALIGVLIFNPLTNLVKCGVNQTTQGNNVQVGDAIISDVGDTEADTTEKSEDDTSEEGTTDTDTSEDEDTDDTTDDTTDLSGVVKFVVGTISFDENDDGDPWRLTEVMFSIDNQKEDFRPRIKGYAYASDDPDEIKDIVRIDSTFPSLGAGLSKTYKIAKFKSKYLSPDSSNDPKIYLQLYDADTGALLKEAEKTIK